MTGTDVQPDPRTTGLAQVELAIDDAEPVTMHADTLLGELETWRPRLDRADTLRVRLDGLARWPEPQRRVLFEFLAGLENACVVTIDGTSSTDPFEAVVAAMAGPDRPLAEQAATQRAAIEAAAVFYSEAPELATEHINRRVTELGAPTISRARLLRQIRTQAQAPGSASEPGHSPMPITAPAPDGMALARSFIDELRERTSAGPDEPVLWHYRDRWYAWSGIVWRVTDPAELRARIISHLQRMNEPVTDALVKQVLLNVMGMVTLDCANVDPPFHVRGRAPLQVEPRRVIRVANGTIDLDRLLERGGPALEPVDPRLFVSTALPVAFDAEAVCPMWEQFLRQILPASGADDRRIEVLQEFLAYLLLDDCRFERMLCCLGQGANGKSTALRVIEALLGAANVAHIPFDQLTDRFRLHELEGKRVNISSELDNPDRASEAVLKQLISGEPRSTDRKHRDAFELRSTAKLILACNELPAFTPGDKGLWRRLIVMPFDETFEDDRADPHLAERLIDHELPGILNWGLAALPRLFAQGGFTRCGRCERAATHHRYEGDSVTAFIDDCCELEATAATERDAVYQLYVRHVRTRQGPGVRPLTRDRFGRRLHAPPLQLSDGRCSKGRRAWLYKGIRFSPEGQALWEEMHRR